MMKMMKIVTFLSYSVFDELHYLKKPGRNLETFEFSLYFNNLLNLQQMSEDDKEN